jgi:glycosyltransferase involved in cell wall biosynthesis
VIGGALDLSKLARTSAAGFDIRREFGAESGVLLGICLGGVRPQKGIDILLAAVARCGRRRALKIVVVGGVRDADYWSHCVADVRRLRLENEIVFAGERVDVRAWHGQFDFGVHAARSESGPLVVIEHLAAGLPLICTRTGGIARRAEDLGVERFVAPDDAGALADALDELAGSPPEERLRRARTAREIAHAHFDIRSIMPAWRDVYDRALRGVRSTAN